MREEWCLADSQGIRAKKPSRISFLATLGVRHLVNVTLSAVGDRRSLKNTIAAQSLGMKPKHIILAVATVPYASTWPADVSRIGFSSSRKQFAQSRDRISTRDGRKYGLVIPQASSSAVSREITGVMERWRRAVLEKDVTGGADIPLTTYSLLT